jgi:putative ABC transport system permease protein
MNNQINFMDNKKLGFDKNNIVNIPLTDENIRTKGLAFRNELKNIPNIINASASTDIPYNGFTSNGYIPEGQQSSMMINVVHVDENFFNTYDIEIVNGRNFHPELKNDGGYYIVNETLAKSLSWENPLGKKIRRDGDHEIIGVVKDFHFASLYNQITPLIITPRPWDDKFNYISIKFGEGDISATLNDIDEAWKQFAPLVPMEYHFLDKSFENLYIKEKLYNKMLMYFTIIAMVIGLLGAYSLVSYSVSKKTKEIGIRKVLGASSGKILNLIGREFLFLMLIGNMLAWPIAFFAINIWQQNFAYRINISLSVFLYSSLIVIILVLAIISIKTIKAALANPVDAIKYE